MTDSVEVVNGLGAVWSPDFDAFAEGRLDASGVRCLMCEQAPCGTPRPCPTFGSVEYMRRLDEIHGRLR